MFGGKGRVGWDVDHFTAPASEAPPAERGADGRFHDRTQFMRVLAPARTVVGYVRVDEAAEAAAAAAAAAEAPAAATTETAAAEAAPAAAEAAAAPAAAADAGAKQQVVEAQPQQPQAAAAAPAASAQGGGGDAKASGRPPSRVDKGDYVMFSFDDSE